MYRVLIGYVTVETTVGSGRAHVDIRRGEALPDDVPAEQLQQLLAAGAVEEEPEAEPEPKPTRKRKTG